VIFSALFVELGNNNFIAILLKNGRNKQKNGRLADAQAGHCARAAAWVQAPGPIDQVVADDEVGL
jgi:hypothetical protein